MNKKFFNKLILLSLIMSLVFGITACSGDPSQNDSGSETVTVSMNILYPKDSSKKNVENYSMNVSKEATILQVLEAYCEQEGIETTSGEMGGKPYITGINGVVQTNSKAWTYEINDEPVMEMPSDQKIEGGDKIVWKYGSY